jgi:hypothetical protein
MDPSQRPSHNSQQTPKEKRARKASKQTPRRECRADKHEQELEHKNESKQNIGNREPRATD